MGTVAIGECSDCPHGYQCGIGTDSIGTEGEPSTVACDAGYWSTGLFFRKFANAPHPVTMS